MPTGPKGQKRPADVIGNAVKVMRIATGEEQETDPRPARILPPSLSGTAQIHPRADDNLDHWTAVGDAGLEGLWCWLLPPPQLRTIEQWLGETTL
jgi:hypothetical protein